MSKRHVLAAAKLYSKKNSQALQAKTWKQKTWDTDSESQEEKQ